MLFFNNRFSYDILFLCIFVSLIIGTSTISFADTDRLGEGFSSDHGLARRAKLLKEKNGTYLIDNIRWGIKSKNPNNVIVEEREFYWNRALINPKLVDNIYLILKPFKPKLLAAHGYSLITFKKGGFYDAKGFNPEGLVISFEIFKKKGITLKDLDFVRDATHKVYEIDSVITTWEDYVTIDCGLSNNKLKVYKMNLNHKQKVQYINEILRLSVKVPEGEFYHTLNNSCVTKQMDAMNSVLPKKQQIKRKIFKNITNPNASIPTFIVGAFSRRGVLTKLKTKITGKNYFAPINDLMK